MLLLLLLSDLVPLIAIPLLIHTFLRRPALVQSSLVIPNRFASSRCVASTLRSLRRTYHSLCKSSNDFKRSSLAFHARPIHSNKLFSHVLPMDSCRDGNAHEPVQICFGKASPFSKNWANPLALLVVVVVVLLAAAVVVLNARTEERASRCNKDICVYVCMYCICMEREGGCRGNVSRLNKDKPLAVGGGWWWCRQVLSSTHKSAAAAAAA